MKRTVLIPFTLSFAALSLAQTQPPDTWVRLHFGLNMLLPGPARGSATDYAQWPLNPNDPTDPNQLNNISKPTSNTGIASNNSWITPLRIADNLGNDVTISGTTYTALHGDYKFRIPGYEWLFYPNSSGATAAHQGFVYDYINRLAYRGGQRGISDAQNLLINMTPWLGNDANYSSGWTSLTGAVSVSQRDEWRPVGSGVQSAIGSNISSYIQNVYKYTSYFAACTSINWSTGNLSPSGNASVDFTKRYLAGTDPYYGYNERKIMFQLGNEPGIGHPGGSASGPIGSWQGLFDSYNGIFQSVSFAPPAASNFFGASMPISYAGAEYILPAVSFLADPSDWMEYKGNGGSDYHFNFGHGDTPGENELATCSDELWRSGVSGSWTQNATRRALHFRSPRMLCIQIDGSGNDIYDTWGNKKYVNYIGSGCRWETAAEYAARWVTALKKQLKLVQNLPMKSSSTNAIPTLTDVTELYLSNGSLGCGNIGRQTDGSMIGSISIGSTTLTNLRAAANQRFLDGKSQYPPVRVDVIKAISSAMYAEENGNGTKWRDTYGLGTIYWWGGTASDPRFETGLHHVQQNPTSGAWEVSDDTSTQYNTATTYVPDEDLRLSLDEIKAIFNKTSL